MWDFSEFFFKSKYIMHKNIEKMLFYSILQSKLFSLFCHSGCFTWPNLWQNRSAQVMKTIFKPNSLKIMLGAKLNLRLNFTMICIKMNFIIMQLHYFYLRPLQAPRHVLK